MGLPADAIRSERAPQLGTVQKMVTMTRKIAEAVPIFLLFKIVGDATRVSETDCSQ